MRAQLQIISFLLMVCTSHGFFNSIFRNIRGLRSDRGIESRAESIQESAKEHTEGKPGSIQEVQIPERLFSKEIVLTRKSYCYQARLEFEKLCGLRSASERARLASLVTNCHLEVSGRPVFDWDPETQLADASEHYVYLVMQFVPLMTDVCEKAGRSPLLSQLVADAKSTEDIGKKINELQIATERLFEANLQSSEFVMEYMNMSADASRKLRQMLNLSKAIQEANIIINNQWKAIHQEANDIKAELRAFTRNSITLFDTMFGRFDGFQNQMRSMSSAVGQIQADSHATSMFLKEPLEAISNTSEFMDSRQASVHDSLTTIPLGPFRKVGFLRNIILGPIKLSERIRLLESNRFLGPFAKDIFSSIQMFLILMSVYIAYNVLTMFTKVFEAVIRFASIFKPFQPMVVKLSRLFGKVYGPHATAQQQPTIEQLSEHIAASVSKALASAALAENVANILRNDETDTKFSLLFTSLSELDTRLSQISQDVRHLRSCLQSLDRQHIREACVSEISHGTFPVQNESNGNQSNGMSLVTRAEMDSRSGDVSDKADVSHWRRTTTADEKTIHIDQEISAKRLSDLTNPNGALDHTDNVSDRKGDTVAPKRQLTRRRSSRRKVR